MTTSRKIGIVTEYFFPHLGGVTEHVYFYACQLARRGFSVSILTGYEGEEEIDVKIPSGVKVIRLGRSVPIYSERAFAKVTMGWNLGQRIQRVLEEEKFDLLHIHIPLTPTLPMLVQKFAKTVIIGTFHSYFRNPESIFLYSVFRRFIERYWRKFDGFIAVSPFCLQSWKRFWEMDCTIIPNGVDIPSFERGAGKIAALDDGSPKVLFLGRLDPRNGLETLLAAFPRVVRKIPEAQLVVVGDGPMRRLFEKQAGPMVGRNVFFEGSINGTRAAYFASTDLFCYPAHHATFGVTLLEAMAASRPVVAADNGGFRHVIQDGNNGLLVPGGDQEALAGALVRLLRDKELSGKLAANGRRFVEDYSWPRVTDRVLDFYNQVYQRVRGENFC